MRKLVAARLCLQGALQAVRTGASGRPCYTPTVAPEKTGDVPSHDCWPWVYRSCAHQTHASAELHANPPRAPCKLAQSLPSFEVVTQLCSLRSHPG